MNNPLIIIILKITIHILESYIWILDPNCDFFRCRITILYKRIFLITIPNTLISL